MRRIDRLTVEHYSVPSLLLMEAAANASLRAISQRLHNGVANKKVLVLCGPGNNGGDGAALARALTRTGAHADVILFGKVEDTKGDARINFEAVSRLASFEAGSSAGPPPLSFLECDSLHLWEEVARPRTSYDAVVDALFGTGLTRPLQGIYLQVVQHLEMLRAARERARGARPLIVSLDIPSGLDADRAQPIGETVQADMTVTFTAPKPANVLPPACYFCGELIVSEIGSPATLIEAADSKFFVAEAEDARRWLQATRYTRESYKNTHGHALIIAGSRDYSGAAALAGNSAIRSGAGLVTIATPVAAQVAVASRAMPEVITTALPDTDRGAVSDEAVDYVKLLFSRSSAVAIGPGLTDSDERTRSFVRSVVSNRTTPVVVDADGLNCLAPWPKELKGSKEFPLVLTPHPGEMLRLLGTEDKSVLSDRVSMARSFALEHQLILVLKGSRTMIATPEGLVFVNPTGNAGLGTAGTGDTLTGVITGFLAQSVATLKERADAAEAVMAAVYISSLAADIAASKLGMRSMVASDIRDHLNDAVRLLDPDGELPDSRNLDEEVKN
jgi:ADP-dependent NAD(P)H-hydrate dehydratase / NAD(P)H-hydrate epimerase